MSLARGGASRRTRGRTRPTPVQGAVVFGGGGNAAPPPSAAPLLRVSLFGGLEVSVGEQRVEPGRLSRRKSRALLAILVIGRGREMARDRLAELLWPTSDADVARRNFYSVLSQLKRAISSTTDRARIW